MFGMATAKWQKVDVGRLHRKRIEGFVLVRHHDIAERSVDMAQRAALTNSRDLPAALQEMRVTGRISCPENAWLGIVRRMDCKGHDGEIDLPAWALGYEIVEEDEPTGCFFALGYCRRGEEGRFEVAKQYYGDLVVRDS